MLRKSRLLLAAASVLAFVGVIWAASSFWSIAFPALQARDPSLGSTSAGTGSSALPSAFGAQAIGPGGLGNWQFLGPNNVGGPTSFVGFRPDSAEVVYAVSRLGDVFLSDDGGSSWRFLSHVPLRDARLEFVPGQPAIVYAFSRRTQIVNGTSGVALWKSVDAGQSWSALVPELSNQVAWIDDVDSMRVVPGMPQVLWVAGRNGLMRSGDGGRNWSLVFNTGYSNQCGDLQVSSVHAKVYAVCRTPTPNVVSSNLDGVGWSILTQRSSDEPVVRLAMSRSNEQVLYLATFDKANSPYNARYLTTVSRTSDGGMSWNEAYNRAVRTDEVSRAVPGDLENECGMPDWGVSTPEFNAIAVDPANPDRLWVAGFEIFRSDNAGASFGRAVARAEQVDDPALGAFQGLSSYFGFLSLAFPPNYDGTNVQVMFAAGHQGIERSTNAGGLAPAAPVLSCANRIASGITLQPRNNGYAATRIVHGSMASSGAMVISGPDMDVGLSDGSGPDSWVRLTPLKEMLVGQTSIDPVEGVDRFNVSWGMGVVNWSWNATARRWIPTQNNFVNSGGNSPGYLLPGENLATMSRYFVRTVRDPANRMRMVSGSDDGVYESRDGGKFWMLISPNVPVESYGIKRDGSIIAGTDDGYLLSQASPYTQSWQKHDLDGCVLTPGHLCTGLPVNFTRFLLGPDPADVGLFASAENFDRAKVWYSPDGRRWTALDRPGQPGGLPRYWGSTSLAIDPDNPAHLYAGTPQGLYVSEDRGQNWVQADAPFPLTPVSHLEFRKEPSGRRQLVAYTYGRGVWTADVAASTAFSDVPTYAWSYDYVGRLYAAGITSGCSAAPISYCPQQPVLREQMAVFLLRAKHGSAYVPPVPAGTFIDVPVQSPFAGWIERLASEGITSGCGPSYYCPSEKVSRAQIAVFLLRAKYGAAYQPPAPRGRFGDVPTDSPMAAWIEQLAQEGITGGCSASPAKYCPDDPVTREQMAVFMVKAFGL